MKGVEKMLKKKEKQHIVANEKAITLIALVVTIVILLILAGVTITMTLGQNGLFTRAREGAAAYNESEVRDDLSMLITQYTWDKAAEKTDKSLGDYLKENGATSVKANANGKTLEVEYKGYVFTVNNNFILFFHRTTSVLHIHSFFALLIIIIIQYPIYFNNNILFFSTIDKVCVTNLLLYTQISRN